MKDNVSHIPRPYVSFWVCVEMEKHVPINHPIIGILLEKYHPASDF